MIISSPSMITSNQSESKNIEMQMALNMNMNKMIYQTNENALNVLMNNQMQQRQSIPNIPNLMLNVNNIPNVKYVLETPCSIEGNNVNPVLVTPGSVPENEND